MNNKPEDVKCKLESILKDMSDHAWLYSNGPSRDFTRQNYGKLSFYNTI